MKRKYVKIMFLSMTLLTSSITTAYATIPEDEKKEEYYQEYDQICKEINKTTNQNISLLPRKDINNEDLVEPSVFKETVSDITKAEYQDIVASGNILKASSVLNGKFTKTKSCSVKVNSTKSITINCKLTGTYYYDKSMKRCYFGKINNPTFTVSGGSWKNRGYTKSLIDGSRTAYIELKGKAVVGSNYTKNFSRAIEFHCTEEGKIK